MLRIGHLLERHGFGAVVPGTGVHVNNMLGEEDLNPLGFHLAGAGARLPSMMSPTMVLRDGELVAGLGSGGSNGSARRSSR